MHPGTLDYASAAEFDTGRFAARYLQVLAWVSIASMVAGPIFFDSLHVDVSPIFLFWAAAALKRRSRAARVWVLAIGGLMLGVVLLMLTWAVVGGTDGMAVSLGFRRVENPALWQVVAVAVPLAAVLGIPLAVLASTRARRQFGRRGAAAPPRVDAAEVARRVSEVG